MNDDYFLVLDIYEKFPINSYMRFKAIAHSVRGTLEAPPPPPKKGDRVKMEPRIKELIRGVH